MPLPNWRSSGGNDRHCEECSDEAIQQRGSGLLRFARNDGVVRIDRFLFFIRLLKSRTLAQTLIDAGHVRIDGKRVEKPSESVRIGSIIAFPLHDHVRVIRVLSLPNRRGPTAEARACYQELGIDEPKSAT